MNIKKFDFILFFKQLFLFFLGLAIIQIGVALFLGISIGADPFTVFTQGFSKLFNMSVGNTNRILTFILFIVVLLFDRKNINIGTLLAVLFTGTFLDIAVSLFSFIPFENFNLISKILLFLIACIPISFGFPILKSANLGVAPNDLVYLAIVDYLKKPYSIIRMCTDISFIVIGGLLGGIIGLGTVICILLLGPLTEFFMSRIENFIKKYIY